MLTIRPYRADDAVQVGILIADTYNEFNLSELTARQREEMLGPFLYARSPEPAHQKAIAEAICAPTVLVAEIEGQIVGILRGGRTDELGRTILQSLFVSGSHQREGSGHQVLECL